MTEELKKKLYSWKGKKEAWEKDLSDTEKEIRQYKRRMINAEEAQLILQQVSIQTQEELEYHISDIVSMALSAVFDNPYELELQFVDKRGKIEAEISFVRNGEKINPIDSSGGGAVDIASFALRIALWSLARPRTRNTIVLDEPFRFLSRELQPKAGEMLSILSNKLGLQFILVTHNQDLIDSADKVFEVEKQKDISIVKETT